MSFTEKLPSSKESIWKTRFFKYGAILLALILASVFLMACKFFEQAVLVVIFTAIFTFILSKPVAFFERKGINRGLGTILAILLAVLFIVVCVIAFVPPIVEQLMNLFNALPGYMATIENEVLPRFPELQQMMSQENVDAATKAASDWLGANGGNIAAGALDALSGFAGGLGYAFGIIFVTLILTMTFLTDLPKFKADFMKIFSPETNKQLSVVGRALGDSFYGWLKMMSTCGFVFGVVTAIILQLIGVPYAFVVGLFCFIAFFIPAVGPVVAAVVAGLAGLCAANWWMCFVAFAITFIVVTVIQSTIQPRLTATHVNINPGIALFAGMVGSIIWGPIGMLIGVPIYAALQAVFVEYMVYAKGTDIRSDEGILFFDGAKQAEKEKQKKKKLAGNKVEDIVAAEQPVQNNERPKA